MNKKGKSNFKIRLFLSVEISLLILLDNQCLGSMLTYLQKQTLTDF